MNRARTSPTCGARSVDGLHVAVIAGLFGSVSVCSLFQLYSFHNLRALHVAMVHIFRFNFFSFPSCFFCVDNELMDQYLLFVVTCSAIPCLVALHFSLFALADASLLCVRTARAFCTVQRFHLGLLASPCYIEEHGEIVCHVIS